MSRSLRVRSWLALAALALPAGVACGSRTGLYTLGEPGDAGVDEGLDQTSPPPGEEPDGDGVPDATVDVAEGQDGAAGDEERDAFEEPDTLTGLDAAEDALDAAGDRERAHDAREEADALPPLDGTFADAPSACPDAGATLVYVVTAQSGLYSFYPPTLAFTPIGTVSCPGAGSTSPFSMAVDREGIAFVVFTDGRLWRVDTATATCTPTTYAVDQHGFATFGMGYTGRGDGGEALYVDEESAGGSTSPSVGLGTIDTATMTLDFISAFTPPTPGLELTGTNDGRLFGFSALATGGSHIVEIDKSTAAIIGDSMLKVGAIGDAWAFALWGGDFWVFTSPGSATTVTRYDPAAGTEATATTFAETIVGAGVSTCAPQ